MVSPIETGRNTPSAMPCSSNVQRRSITPPEPPLEGHQFALFGPFGREGLLVDQCAQHQTSRRGVLGERPDERIDPMNQLFGSLPRISFIAAKPPLEPFDDPIEDFAVEHEFGRKMMKERRLAQADGLCDLAHADAAIPAGGEE